MPSTKLDKSKLIAKSDSTSEPPLQCRDLVILGISFMFTIAVACCILAYINNNQINNVADIQKVVEGILAEKFAKNIPRDFERKRGHLVDKEENSRNKRAIDNGEKITLLSFEKVLN